MAKLIEPTYKDKLGIGLSYPIGTQLISESLEGVPQYDSLSIHYRKHKGPWLAASPMRDLYNIEGDVLDLYPFDTVIQAYYSKQQESWSIIVYRTLKAQNKLVHDFLLSIGLVLIKNWLSDERSETWYNGFRTFQIGLNTPLDQYAVRETFNNRLIDKHIHSLSVLL